MLSYSIQYIEQLFHLHQTFPHNQTLNFNLRKKRTSLCKSIHSIDQLQSYSVDFTLTFRKISPCLVIPYYLSISWFIFILFVPTIRLYTIILENSLSRYAFHTLFDHLQSEIFYAGRYTPNQRVAYSFIYTTSAPYCKRP